jgi:hypothetical protein
MGPLLTARLAAWRELYARWPLYLICPFFLLLALVSSNLRFAVQLFVLLVLLPPLTVFLAARPGARSDPFWRGRTLRWVPGRLIEEPSGRSWNLPSSPFDDADRKYPDWSSAFEWDTRLIDDRLRVFLPNRIEEIDTDGTVTVLARFP